VTVSGHEAEQLRVVADQAKQTAEYLGDDAALLDALEEAVGRATKAWSGSNLGYHANVYYKNLAPPPPGEHFSSEWGLMGSFAPGTSGDWREYADDEVAKAVREEVSALDQPTVAARAAQARDTFSNLRSRFESILSVVLRAGPDEYLEQLRKEADDLIPLTVNQAIRAQLPSGQLMSRDAVAVQAGLKAAPHQIVMAEVVDSRSPHSCLVELARIAGLAADHIELAVGSVVTRVQTSDRVFIGHGRSLLWHPLKDFLQDRLGLLWDEFNRVPVAGLSNVSVLERMLDEAMIAFLVLTAEDEQADGTTRARQNVVHEAGLFQGRLGFSRAIILLEEGCEEFSNVHGVGQVRFPRGDISATFEEIRRVLEREGIIEEG
jgi:predicted nucleotide-binding protein